MLCILANFKYLWKTSSTLPEEATGVPKLELLNNYIGAYIVI
jgi:hypothetical protein